MSSPLRFTVWWPGVVDYTPAPRPVLPGPVHPVFNSEGTLSATVGVIGAAAASAALAGKGTLAATVRVSQVSVAAEFSGEGTVNAIVNPMPPAQEVSAEFSGEGTLSATVTGS